MKKGELREQIKSQLEEFQKKGKKIKDCPLKAAANCKIMGRPGHKYVKEVNEQSKRRIRNYGK